MKSSKAWLVVGGLLMARCSGSAIIVRNPPRISSSASDGVQSRQAAEQCNAGNLAACVVLAGMFESDGFSEESLALLDAVCNLSPNELPEADRSVPAAACGRIAAHPIASEGASESRLPYYSRACNLGHQESCESRRQTIAELRDRDRQEERERAAANAAMWNAIGNTLIAGSRMIGNAVAQNMRSQIPSSTVRNQTTSIYGTTGAGGSSRQSSTPMGRHQGESSVTRAAPGRNGGNADQFTPVAPMPPPPGRRVAENNGVLLYVDTQAEQPRVQCRRGEQSPLVMATWRIRVTVQNTNQRAVSILTYPPAYWPNVYIPVAGLANPAAALSMNSACSPQILPYLPRQPNDSVAAGLTSSTFRAGLNVPRMEARAEEYVEYRVHTLNAVSPEFGDPRIAPVTLEAPPSEWRCLAVGNSIPRDFGDHDPRDGYRYVDVYNRCSYPVSLLVVWHSRGPARDETAHGLPGGGCFRMRTSAISSFPSVTVHAVRGTTGGELGSMRRAQPTPAVPYGSGVDFSVPPPFRTVRSECPVRAGW